MLLSVHISFLYAQQISTDNTQQVNTLIQGLVGSDCSTASNISSTINGNTNNIISYGSFNKENSNFPLQSGLVLSTGNISSTGNTVNTSDLSDGTIDWATDSDILDVLGIDQTLNATSIEFDFQSVNNFISFKYLFASDEYQQEYPCNFKDVFAILIKRVGSADPYVNIALIPDSITEISTNNIHPNITGFCEAQNEDYFAGYNIGDTNFNGRTEVLTASTDIIPNETYHIKLIIADHIDERFDSAVFIEAEGFGNSIDLGPDQTICGTDLTLDANINNATAVYSWFLDGNPITGENNPTLQVDQSGNYEVEVSIPTSGNNCLITDSIAIEIIPFQESEPIEDWSVCDPEPSDGVYSFDFTLKNDAIYANLPSTNYNITYYLSQEDSQNNQNAIEGFYQNTYESETIYVRIESLNGDCLRLGSFEISVLFSPNTHELTVEVCNDAFSDLAFSYMDFFDIPVSNFEFNTTVSYHLTEEDAINFVNIITEIPDFQNRPNAIYARVVSDFTGCHSIVPINLYYAEPPEAFRYILDSCLSPSHTENIDGETYNYETLPISYEVLDIFEEFETAYPEFTVQLELFIIDYPPIINTSETSFNIPVSIRYVGEDCPTHINIEIHKNLLYNLLKDEYIVSRCDDSSNDGIIDINLSDLSEELKNGFEIDITLYETEEDRALLSNALDLNTTISVVDAQNIYISSMYKDCSLNSKITFEIEPLSNVDPISIDYCGNTDLTTSTSIISIPPLIEQIQENFDMITDIELYLSQEDVENQNNPIYEEYEVTGSQQIFYARITDLFSPNQCSNFTTVEVNIANSINATNPEDIIVCDMDQDGFAVVNLESVIPQLSSGNDNILFTFFNSYENATENLNPITDTDSYLTESTELFIRADFGLANCFTVFRFNILIYEEPQLNSIPTFINCEENPSFPSEFLFINKDINIINGQNNMQVLYFENEDNAINRVNPIDKNAPFSPTTNPQTIFVRLENVNENSCFKVAPMQVEVRQAPIFNNPTDIFECDINKTGFSTTDLNEKITEISAGSTTDLNISFHLTPLNAETGANEIPLNYTATSNPQLIYARIENSASGCVETPTFNFNTLSLPEITSGHSLTKCANNYEFSQQWNLSEIELNILEGRQYNIAFSYYESQTDLLEDNNPILNPETYTNTSNPQTLYAKITNATTGCYDSVSFQLQLNSPPLINEFETFNICENSENSVNLSEINELLLDNTFNVIINYYTSETDAEAKENPLNTNYIYTNSIENLFVRVEYSTTNCYAIYPFQLVVNSLPTANQPSDLEACDNDFDGFTTLDLTSQNSAILGNQNLNEYTITYYNSELNAHEHNNPLNFIHTAQNGESIFARLENNLTGCYDVTQFSVIINSPPYVAVADQVICLNDLPLLVSVESNNPSDTYLWSTNATDSTITITEIGTYSVTITNELGCQNTSTFNVIESDSATIDVIETIDFADPNNITVTITGIGNYLYQLNTGDLQTSNVFKNVPIGYNDITIIDQNGCASITKEVLVIDTPKHISPNNDGAFDTWHITGVETLPGTVINIFDRKGKLLIQLNHNSLGWDGTYNGKKMPASDYWYVANVVQNGKQFQIKGHFSLKR